MLEVYNKEGRWYWHWICSQGKPLYAGKHHYRTQQHAAEAAKIFRKRFMALAAEIDHRQGACV